MSNFTRARSVNIKSFKAKKETISRTSRYKREYLDKPETRKFIDEINKFVELRVEVKRIRNGESQSWGC